MQPSTVEKESSGRSARSGRSGRSGEEVVKGRKKVVMELEKVAAERDGWTAVKGTETAVEKESSGRSTRSGRSGRSGEEVVKGRKKVVMELKKVAAERDGWTAVKGTETAVECSGRSVSGLEKVVERRQKVKVAEGV